MTDPVQPHDKLFKALTDDPRLAAALLRERLPPDIAALLADAPPEPLDGEYIDPALRASQSDRLFRVRLTTGDTALLYVLVEHKSAPDPGLPLQLLGYMLAIWRRHTGSDVAKLRALPPILPVVIYHGARPWAIPVNFRDLVAAAPAVRALHLDYSYTLSDLGRIDDDRLSQTAVLRAGLLALKYALRGGDPWPTVLAIMQALPDDELLVRPLFKYILSVYESVDRAMLMKAAAAARPEGESVMLSIAAREWLAEGKAEGRAEGKAEGLRDGQVRSLLRVLERRFGLVDETTRRRLEDADTDLLDFWFDRVLDAPTLDSVFSDRPLQ